MAKKKVGKRGVERKIKPESWIALAVLVIALCFLLFSYLPRKMIVEQYELPAPPADAILITSCMELNQAGKYYALQNNINEVDGTCFSIIADNIVLDGQGFSIAGNATGNGVQSSAKNSIVQNIDVSNFAVGVTIPQGANNASLILINSHDNLVKDVNNFYSVYAQIKTMQDGYKSTEQVNVTDASEVA